MALAGRVGFEYEGHEIESIISAGGTAEILFGEGGARFLVAVPEERWDDLQNALGGVAYDRVGITGGDRFKIGDLVDVSLQDLRKAYERDLFGAPGGGGDSLSVDKVNIEEKLALFDERWRPKIVGELNGQYVKLVKFIGEFVWHHHDDEDELFLVVKGRFRMEFRDRSVWIEEGEFIVVPRGVEHRPVAEEEAHVLLFEPASTLNTGNVRNERTVAELDRI